MKPFNVSILDIKYRRPGINMVKFHAVYPEYVRRGTVFYDTQAQHFLTHTKDIELLAAICTSLQQPHYNQST